MRPVSIILAALGLVALTGCGAGAGAGVGAESAPTTTAPATTTSAAPATTTTVAAPTTTTTTSTTTTTTTTTMVTGLPTAPVVAGADPDVDAVVEAYSIVFDSTTTYEEKAPFVIDFAGLEDTVLDYASVGGSLGGIALRADEVGIDGNEARVIYSFLFAGNPRYTDLEGTAVRTDDGWQITREFFCDIMASARVGCP